MAQLSRRATRHGGEELGSPGDVGARPSFATLELRSGKTAPNLVFAFGKTGKEELSFAGDCSEVLRSGE